MAIETMKKLSSIFTWDVKGCNLMAPVCFSKWPTSVII